MWQDPIVEEIHKIREAQAAQFQYDVQALGKFFQAQQAAEHREVVSRAPRRAPEGAQPTRVVQPEPNTYEDPRCQETNSP
jgi:hypothetical protein